MCFQVIILAALAIFAGTQTVATEDVAIDFHKEVHLFLNPKPPQRSNNQQDGAKDFFLVTIPKSGTHLMTKLIYMLTGKRENPLANVDLKGKTFGNMAFEKEMFHLKTENQYALSHLNDTRFSLFWQFAVQHPQYVRILQIRDLRDVFVSLVHYYDKEYPQTWSQMGLTVNSNFDEKLTGCITTQLSSTIKNALPWYQDPNVIVMRFEAVVGPSGKGNADWQQQSVVTLANALGIRLTSEKLQYILNNLFGTSSGPQLPTTYYSGQIGSWKNCFKPEHVRLFNDIWGDYQIAFGYPLAE